MGTRMHGELRDFLVPTLLRWNAYLCLNLIDIPTRSMGTRMHGELRDFLVPT
ncbi:MAG: hypothetical protein ACI909_001689, partial [Planctomycetota bacterium]